MMAGDLRDGEGIGDAAILQALKKLSGRRMTAARMDDGGMTYGLSRDGGVDYCGEIDAAAWAMLVGRGWVVAEADGPWRISNAGRIQLKRLLSRSETGKVGIGSGARPNAARAVARETQTSVAESPLAWLYRRTDRQGRPLISQAQFEAGERLRADFERGNMGPRLTANWSGVGGANPGCAGPDFEIELRAHAIAARERVRGALAAAGPELSGILIDVCCHLKGLAEVERNAGWPQRTAKVVLLMALTTLARHYGLISSAIERHDRVRHWGAENYRPALEPFQL